MYRKLNNSGVHAKGFSCMQEYPWYIALYTCIKEDNVPIIHLYYGDNFYFQEDNSRIHKQPRSHPKLKLLSDNPKIPI